MGILILFLLCSTISLACGRSYLSSEEFYPAWYHPGHSDVASHEDENTMIGKQQDAKLAATSAALFLLWALFYALTTGAGQTNSETGNNHQPGGGRSPYLHHPGVLREHLELARPRIRRGLDGLSDILGGSGGKDYEIGAESEDEFGEEEYEKNEPPIGKERPLSTEEYSEEFKGKPRTFVDWLFWPLPGFNHSGYFDSFAE